MKVLSCLFLLGIVIQVNAQIPKSGTYIYNYCDVEYNRCIGKCKVKIIGNKVWVYAPANLTGIKEGELFENGILFKHKNGKWYIIHSNKEKKSLIVEGCDAAPWFDFKRKRFWIC